jgi:hypothetical protein
VDSLFLTLKEDLRDRSPYSNERFSIQGADASYPSNTVGTKIFSRYVHLDLLLNNPVHAATL